MARIQFFYQSTFWFVFTGEEAYFCKIEQNNNFYLEQDLSIGYSSTLTRKLH
jgi:hypothetical protein